MFNAYNDMRKRLGDVRNEIAIIGRKNHDAEQTIKRFVIVILETSSKLFLNCLGEISFFGGNDRDFGQAESGA